MQDFALLNEDDQPITFGAFADVPPGTDYIAKTGEPLVVKIQNTTPEPKTAHKLVVYNKAPYTIAPYISFSLDGETFVTGELPLGSFAPGEVKTIYCNATVPAGAAGGSRQRCYCDITPDNG